MTRKSFNAKRYFLSFLGKELQTINEAMSLMLIVYSDQSLLPKNKCPNYGVRPDYKTVRQVLGKVRPIVLADLANLKEMKNA